VKHGSDSSMEGELRHNRAEPARGKSVKTKKGEGARFTKRSKRKSRHAKVIVSAGGSLCSSEIEPSERELGAKRTSREERPLRCIGIWRPSRSLQISRRRGNG